MSTGSVVGPEESYWFRDGVLVPEPDGALSTNDVEGRRIDGTGLSAVPGYIDIQINGGFGIDLVSEPGRMWELGERLPARGVTAFLPTLVSGDAEQRSKAVGALAARPQGYLGAEPIGLHLEGPLINPARRGAHREANLRSPTRDLTAEWSPAHGVLLVTLAPELDGALAAIEELTSRGVVVSMGHSDATAAQARAGRERGARLVTHLFNAMSPLGHRELGLAGVALTDDELSVSLIVDGVHLDDSIVALVWRQKGPEGVVLISDAVAAMGQPFGPHDLGGVDGDSGADGVRLADGTLAGSAGGLDEAVRRLARCTGCSTTEATAAASANPARLLGLADRGSLRVGNRADLVLVDSNLEVQMTLVGGQVGFVAEGARHRLL